MELRFHSGGCCGFKVICNLGQSPEGYLHFGEHELEGCPDRDADETFCSANVIFEPKGTFEVAGRTNKDGFADIMQYLNDNRPGSMVQVIITLGVWDQSGWIPILEGYGFEKVSEFVNGNSGNLLSIFHAHIRKGEEREEEEEDYDDTCDCDDCVAERARED